VPGRPSEVEWVADPLRHRFIVVFDREGNSPAFLRASARDIPDFLLLFGSASLRELPLAFPDPIHPEGHEEHEGSD